MSYFDRAMNFKIKYKIYIRVTCARGSSSQDL